MSRSSPRREARTLAVGPDESARLAVERVARLEEKASHLLSTVALELSVFHGELRSLEQVFVEAQSEFLDAIDGDEAVSGAGLTSRFAGIAGEADRLAAAAAAAWERFAGGTGILAMLREAAEHGAVPTAERARVEELLLETIAESPGSPPLLMRVISDMARAVSAKAIEHIHLAAQATSA